MVARDYIRLHEFQGKTDMRWRIYVWQRRCDIKFSHLEFYLFSPGKVVDKFHEHSCYWYRKHYSKKSGKYTADKNRQNNQKRRDAYGLTHNQRIDKMIFKLLDNDI